MRSALIVDYHLRKLPNGHLRWCYAAEDKGCACFGCVVSRVSKDEWLDWCKRYNYCECCGRFDEDGFYQGVAEGKGGR